jgi:hypothetical protein
MEKMAANLAKKVNGQQEIPMTSVEYVEHADLMTTVK